jgi:serine/threonine protein kinase
MGNPAATLERENLSAMNASAPQIDDPERPRTPTLKFTYPSGSRPLDGYTIKRGVGRGGFGEVYFATSDAGKEVALKLIRRNLEVELRGVTQCLNLKHPNLINLYDIKTDEMGDQWVVMEYVSGDSLEDVIERNPNGLPIDQVLWWMRGMCGGVAYLHDHGIVHRDLKPGNIFSDEGTVKIGDYGLAKFISCSRRSGQTESVGTVHYMAPEIANGRYGREIDTYALGIILFEMLTGHVPFEGESVGEVLMKHLTAEPDLSVLQEPYRNIVQRALAKDPNVRVKSVGELVAMLPGEEGEAKTYVAPTGAPVNFVSPTESPTNPSAGAQPAAGTATPGSNRFDYGKDRQGRMDSGDQAPANSPTVEEPISKAVRHGWSYARNRWHGHGVQPLSRGQKVLLVIFSFWLASWLFSHAFGVSNGQLPVIFQLLIVYGIYYVCWTLVVRPNIERRNTTSTPSQRTSGEPASAGGAAFSVASPANQQTEIWSPNDSPAEFAARRAKEAKRRRRARTDWREIANRQLAAKPFRVKFTELLGSMLLAAIFASIAACMFPLLSNNQPASEAMAAYCWLVIVGTLGSWAILIPSKFAEGKLEDQVPMRITLMLLGALLGIVAWGVGDALFLQMAGWREPIDAGRGLISQEMLGWPRITDGSNPPVHVYISYFAFLFVLPRWWRQTEFTRATRMSLWCVIACVFTAWLLHIFWWFPQPIGMITAAIIAVSTQLASPWMPPSQRRSLTETIDHT